MPPVNAGTAAPDSGTGSIAANDGDGDLHGEQSKLVAISDEAPNVDRAFATSRPATADGAGGGTTSRRDCGGVSGGGCWRSRNVVWRSRSRRWRWSSGG